VVYNFNFACQCCCYCCNEVQTTSIDCLTEIDQEGVIAADTGPAQEMGDESVEVFYLLHGHSLHGMADLYKPMNHLHSDCNYIDKKKEREGTQTYKWAIFHLFSKQSLLDRFP